MKVIYEGKEIDLNVTSCNITDNIKTKADTIDITFADINNECRAWHFKKGHTIEIVEEGYSTGTMYVDCFGLSNGTYTVRALSIKKNFKTKHTRTWENVTFKYLANDLVQSLGLTLETYEIKDFKYKRVDQIEMNNIEFLKQRCTLEGYILKITNNKAVIISSSFLEKQTVALTLTPKDFIGKHKFECTSNYIYGGCIIRSNEEDYIEGSYIVDNSIDNLLYINNLPVYSIGEADRFSKNILKSFNKNEICGTFTVIKNTKIAAGSTLNIEELSLFSGKYIVEELNTSIIDGKTKLKVRKILEEYK